MATISDICKATGYSKATVSRVINGNPNVKIKTRETVLLAMKSIGYQPNPVAQSLATKRSNIIGLILPHFVSHYFGNILKTITQKVQEANTKLLVMDSHNTHEGEIDALTSLARQKCAAIIIYSHHLTEHELLQLKQETNIPIIALNRLFHSSDISSVGFDQFQIGYLATEHLIQLGHKHIACITPPQNSQTGKQRLTAYKTCLDDHGIVCSKTLISEGNNQIDSGYRNVKSLLDTHTFFTALLCCNDDMAHGAIRALHEAKLSVPTDISVMGIDNEPGSAFSIPSISTISLPIDILATEAINLAIVLTHNPTTQKSLHKIFFGHLIQRESTQSWVSHNT